MQTKLIKDILELEEWSHFECKRAKIKPEKLLETASAFTNTHGGIIAIGLEDPEKSKGADRLCGISEAPDHVSEILKLLDQNIKPPIPWSSTEIEIKNRNNKKDSIMLIRIEKSNDIHSTLKGDTWVRKGRQNTKIGAAEILRLNPNNAVELD